MNFKWLTIMMGLAGSAAMAADGRNFSIAGERFGEAEIVDARAQPELDGTASIRITFGEAAAKRFLVVTQRLAGKPVPVTLDAAGIADPVIHEPVRDGVLQLIGPWTLEQAEDLARRISGKPPLPDSLEQ